MQNKSTIQKPALPGYQHAGIDDVDLYLGKNHIKIIQKF